VTELVSDGVFRGLLSVVTGGVGGLWAIHDVVLLARLRGADRRDPLVGDKRFGYAMGIVIGIIGVVGTLRFNGVL
jgi:hypothetical protein